MTLWFFVIPGFFLVLGGGIVFVGCRHLQAACQVGHWPTSPGTVIGSEIIIGRNRAGRTARNRLTYIPKVKYEHLVAGQRIFSQRVFFTEISSTNRTWAERVVRGYAPQQPVGTLNNQLLGNQPRFGDTPKPAGGERRQALVIEKCC